MMNYTQPRFNMFDEEVAVAAELRDLADELVNDGTEPFGGHHIEDWAVRDASMLYQAARLLDPSS